MGFSRKLNHGEAVLLGINTAIRFSKIKKFLKYREYYSITNHMKNANLPFDLKNYFSIKHLDKILKFMLKDKKNNSEKINLILLKKIGSPIIDKVYKKSDLKTFLKKELTN